VRASFQLIPVHCGFILFLQQAGFTGLPCLAVAVSENLHVCGTEGAPKVNSAGIRVKEHCGMRGKYKDLREPKEICSPLFFKLETLVLISLPLLQKIQSYIRH